MGGYAIPVGFTTIAAVIFAEAAAAPDVSAGVSFPSMIAMLSGGGFSVWYGWYTSSRTIPKMQADNNAALLKMNADNNAVINRLVTDFRDEMKMERQYHDGQINRLVTQIDRMSGPRPNNIVQP